MEEDGDDKDDSKRKSRNLSEKKRRDQFNALVNDLSALITTSNRKMDKSTVLKSTIAFLKHHNEATDRSKVFEIQQDWKPTFLTNDEFTHLMLESLDGFIIVFSSNGSIMYASESVTSLLGYLPADLLNMSIFDISYELDHECLFNIFLNPKPVIEPLQTDITSSNQISFFIHLKRGGIDKVDANAYELVKFVGYFRNDVNLDTTNSQIDGSSPSGTYGTDKLDRKLIFVGTGRIQTPQLIREMSATDPTRNEFTSKHSMEWKFLFLDHRAPPIIGYMPFEVLGTSGYDYYHFDDLDSIVACHEELMQKGEGKSCFYRFLTKGQQWIWLQTDFYISYHQYNSKPEYVVCTHKVVSYADVIRQSKTAGRESQTLLPSKLSVDGSCRKSETITLGTFELTESNLTDQAVNEANIPLPARNTTPTPTPSIGNNSSILLNEPPASVDIGTIWGGTAVSVAQSQHTTPHLRTSRPASSYGNISSTGISTSVKRRRYFSSRGNDSDSTSMSADSGTSKQSMMTHLSSNRQRHSMPLNTHHQSNFVNQQQHQQSANMLRQISNPNSQIGSFHHQSMHGQAQSHTQIHTSTISQGQAQQEVISVLPTTQVVGNNSCQYTQSTFPTLRNPQIVAPTFLEPPQYLTAIPVQPVIAPFPVAPVLSPLTSQPKMLPSPVVMTTQAQIQEQLQRKHDELQKLIMQQQHELRIVSEQLLLARYTLLQPVVPMANYNNNSTSPTTSAAVVVSQAGRTYNFNNSGQTENQLGQYGFTMTSDQLPIPHEQQIMVNQQHQHLQQQQQTLSSVQHPLAHAALQQHDPNQQHTVSPASHQSQQQQQTQQQPQSQSQQHHHHHHHHHQHHHPSQPPPPPPPQPPPGQPTHQNSTHFLSRSVPELDPFVQEDIDAFLNLSPLHTISSSQNALTQITVNGSSAISNMVVGNHVHSPMDQSFVSNAAVTAAAAAAAAAATVVTSNEDSLLTYMQMAAESSPTLNFSISMDEDEAETQNEDTKLLPQPLDQQRQNTGYFRQNAFQTSTNANNNNNSTMNHLPNDLEILPYQMSQEQSQNLFNSPPSVTGP